MSNDIDVPGGPVTEQLSPEEIAARTAAAVGYNYRYKDTYLVGREKIREFSRGIQAFSPVHHDVDAARAAGYEDLVAPPIFFSLVGIIAHRPLFEEAVVGYGLSQVMQSEQKVEYYRPIVAGMELTTYVHFDSFRQIGGFDMIVTRNEIFDQDENLLVRSFTTLMGQPNGDMPDFLETAGKVMMYGTT